MRSPPTPTSILIKLVRKVVTDIGYDDSSKGFDGNSCGVQLAIAKQSGDIDMGVSKSDEDKKGQVPTKMKLAKLAPATRV